MQQCTKGLEIAGVVQWENDSFPSCTSGTNRLQSSDIPLDIGHQFGCTPSISLTEGTFLETILKRSERGSRGRDS